MSWRELADLSQEVILDSMTERDALGELSVVYEPAGGTARVVRAIFRERHVIQDLDPLQAPVSTWEPKIGVKIAELLPDWPVLEASRFVIQRPAGGDPLDEANPTRYAVIDRQLDGEGMAELLLPEARLTVERRAIRCFFSEALKGRTFAGENVRPQRFDPLLPERELDGLEMLASLLVYTLSDQVETTTDSPREYSRRLELAVEVFAQAGPEADALALEDLIDDVCDQVECVIEPRIPELLEVEIPGAGELGFLSVNPSRSGLDRIELGFDARGVQLTGAARLVFLITYSTSVDERAQARATDLETVQATYRFPPPEGTGEVVAADAIDLSEE